MMQTFIRCTILYVLTLLMAGCSGESFNATDVRQTSLGTQLRLQDTSGVERTIQDYSGKVVLLFFGFLQCPDVCPTSMLKAQEVMQLLGEEKASRVQVLFATVDPERDTPDILRQYVHGFDERFDGLWGSVEQTRKVADDFRVHYQKVYTDRASNSYTMEHTASMYIFAPNGQLRLVASYQLTAEQIAADVRRLLDPATP